MKQSTVVFVSFDDRTSCVIVSLPQRTDTQVIYIDPIMGTPIFTGIFGYDVFESKDSALKFVSQNRKIVRAVDAHSILGYIFAGKCCYLILVEKARPLCPIFEKHMVYAIEKVVLIDIPIEVYHNINCEFNIDKIKNYPFDKSHFFCQTIDLSKAFGKSSIVRSCWNKFMIVPFERLSVKDLCISLYQGVITFLPFFQINVGVLFISSRSFPNGVVKQRKHAVKDNVTSREYLIDVYLIKYSDSSFQILNHTFQIGDFPFNWIYDQNRYDIGSNLDVNSKIVKSFVQHNKEYYGVDSFTFVNFMSALENPERVLVDTLENALVGETNCEQDNIEWVQGELPSDRFDELVQCYWPVAASKIQKFGFTKTTTKDTFNFQLIMKQKGIFRFTFGTSFEREIVGLFFFMLKLLEKMCKEFRLAFPDILVTTSNLSSFPSGFVNFAASFILEFYHSIVSFENFQQGVIDKLIYNYISTKTVVFNRYTINFTEYLDSVGAFMHIPKMTKFAVSQSPSSFVFTNGISNAILKLQSGYIDISQSNGDKDIIICLSEPCFIREVILKNTNAVNVSISGGFRVNRIFPIKSKIAIPWMPTSIQGKGADSPYIRISLESQALFYDHELRPQDIAKIRFLKIRFKTFRNEPLKIGGIFAYGANISTFRFKTINEVPKNYCLNSTVSVNYEGKPILDSFFVWETMRLLHNDTYFNFQKNLIERNLSIDAADFESILTIPNLEKEVRKLCTKCQSKDQCYQCVYCGKQFCKKCIISVMYDQVKPIKICSTCQSKREIVLLNIQKLKNIQFNLLNELYPFIENHWEKSIYKPKQNNYMDINRPMIATFAYEPPSPQKKASIFPENLFTINSGYSLDCNMAQFEVIFTCESDINGLQISCNSVLTVLIEGAVPNRLEFHPPGCKQNLSYHGNKAKVMISGSGKIELYHLQFFGIPSISSVDVHTNESSATKRRGLKKAETASVQFISGMNYHDIKLSSQADCVAVKYSRPQFLPKEVIIEFKHDKGVKIIHNFVGSLSANDGMALICFDKLISASSLRIFYPMLSPQFAQVYRTEFPEIMCQQKTLSLNLGKAKKPK